MKIDFKNEWCEMMARKEIGYSVGAGNPFAHIIQCPTCRGIDLEKSWCETCNKTGVISASSNQDAT